MEQFLVAVVCLLAAGCCEKYKCGVPVAEIVVRDQGGAATVVAERKLDDCGNGLSQQVEVVLVPEASADDSVVVVGSALGCG